ncbi:MAG: NOP5/NOP56 family protein [Nanoarchaeota archaeon]|nr:NOP5/NOP56 family protein [Nanoarchaeota archaeon]
MNYIFTNILGTFILDEKLTIVDSLLFKSLEEYKSKAAEAKLQQKHNSKPLPKEKLLQTLLLFKDAKYYHDFYQKNLELTKDGLKHAVNEDNMIMQAIANINELDKIANTMSKRLREWYSLYYPELSEKIENHEKYVELVLEQERNPETFGADLSESDIEEMKLLAGRIISLYALRKQHELYLEKIMSKYCPNMLELAGATIAARLIELGKGLKHLALLPASTVQLLGAEKALFRHLKTGSRSPKYGVIINHPLIQNAPRDKKGKAARMLADKLSLCARLDYFKGEFKAPDYRKELEGKLQ